MVCCLEILEAVHIVHSQSYLSHLDQYWSPVVCSYCSYEKKEKSDNKANHNYVSKINFKKQCDACCLYTQCWHKQQPGILTNFLEFLVVLLLLQDQITMISNNSKPRALNTLTAATAITTKVAVELLGEEILGGTETVGIEVEVA